MPRMPSLRRPVLEAMAENVKRLRKKQQETPDYIFDKDEREAMGDAAKVAALLEKMKPDDQIDPDEKSEPGERDLEAAKRRLEQQTGPTTATRGPDIDSDSE